MLLTISELLVVVFFLLLCSYIFRLLLIKLEYSMLQLKKNTSVGELEFYVMGMFKKMKNKARFEP